MTIDIDPVIGKLGPPAYRWYGLIMMLALVVGILIFSDQLKRHSISPHHAWGIAVVAVPCGIVGARLFHVFENFGYYWHNPGEILGWQLVGLAIYGVLAGGIIGLVLYCRWKKLPVLRVLDCTALAFPVAQIIGKFANIINGDTWGSPTSLAWGFTYVNPASFIPKDLLGVPTHPTPVYEQLWLLVVVGILLYAVPRLKTDGMAILLYLGLYSLGRFFISFFRVNKIIVVGLREAQIIALAVLVLALPAALYLRFRAKQTQPGRAAGEHATPG
ncbi:MAG: prolipoprotein diacylglyceryl transferase [Thermoleophilia bacterium]